MSESREHLMAMSAAYAAAYMGSIGSMDVIPSPARVTYVEEPSLVYHAHKGNNEGGMTKKEKMRAKGITIKSRKERKKK